ncbi:hypothetical protein EDD11_003345 [Mortierella claussenii]|nr:hypothetical protein EDD11_003345 [Mortierella claussenii]
MPASNESYPHNSVQIPPSTTVAELVIAEAHYLSTLKRVGNALNLATMAQGHKAGNTVCALVERWTAMMHIHIQFHDDVVAAKEDTLCVINLLNILLVTLEPMLVEHGRSLSNAVYKLSRNEKKIGHKPAEWEAALRYPFDHLTIYDEWLQRIDPQSQLNRESLEQLNNLVLNVNVVVESNQNPRSMLRRISTMARYVIRRPSNSQLLSSPMNSTSYTSGHSSSDYTYMSGGTLDGMKEYTTASPSPLTSNSATTLPSPNTAVKVTTPSEVTYLASKTSNSSLNPRLSTDLSRSSVVVAEAAGITSESTTETVSGQVSVRLHAITIIESDPIHSGGGGDDKTDLDHDVSTATSSPTMTTADGQKELYGCHHANQMSLADSETSSVRSLTLSASTESLSAKMDNNGDSLSSPFTTSTRSARPIHTLRREMSLASQRQLCLLAEQESRKAVLRSGTHSMIAARAELLQQQQQMSPRKSTFQLQVEKLQMEKQEMLEELRVQEEKEREERESRALRKSASGKLMSRPSIDRLRQITTKKDTSVKPPVKNLINFWEQPVEA